MAVYAGYVGETATKAGLENGPSLHLLFSKVLLRTYLSGSFRAHPTWNKAQACNNLVVIDWGTGT